MPSSFIPGKTALTVATFSVLIFLPQIAPALKNYKSLEPGNIPAVWQFPMPKQAQESGPQMEEIKAARLQLLAPKNLADPNHELDHFYESLRKGGVIRVLHYGDSPTTGDLITADARALLQKQFGDAGVGFVLIAKPWAWYYRRGLDMDASGWTIDVAGASEVKDGLFGLGGASFRGTPGAQARWSIKTGQHATLDISFLSQPGGGAFVLESSGAEIGSVDTDAPEREAAFASFSIPQGAKDLMLRVSRGNVRLYGLEFRKKTPGVIYSSLGVNGANITLLSHAFNNAHWAAQLRHYRPDLVVLAYGTNESGYSQFVDSTWDKELKAVVHRLQAALPGTSILLMSPMDRGEKNDAGEIDTIATLPRMITIERGVAAETGVAFFNTFEAMGGRGTMARWYAAEPRLVGADFIHPMPAGAKIVGELLYNALKDGYNEYKLRKLSETQHESQEGKEVASK